MTIVLDAGADDLRDEGDFWMLVADPSEFHSLRTALEGAGVPIDSAELQMLPTQTVPITDESGAKKVLRLLELFEDNDDVQNVYANFDIPDEIFEAVMA
jgi:transcriptional/translational regulatory protein YebC/TACO1